jgi:hypothetical protein
MSLDEEIRMIEDDLDLELCKRGYAVAELRENYSGLSDCHLLSEGTLGDDPERSASLKQALEGLSAEAREVVGIVLDCPRELVEFVTGKGTNRELTGATVQAWLRWNGWKWRAIWAAFREVKKLLATL